MTTIDQPQLEFRMDASPIERSVIVAQPNFQKVMDLSIDLCHFQNDKDAARALKIDPALLSRRRSGQAPWQIDDVCKVMERGQNLMPLTWLASRYGHGLVMLETEAERRERALREELEQERMRNRVLLEAIRGVPVHA